jgi:dGTP triphosphohydrolase
MFEFIVYGLLALLALFSLMLYRAIRLLEERVESIEDAAETGLMELLSDFVAGMTDEEEEENE